MHETQDTKKEVTATVTIKVTVYVDKNEKSEDYMEYLIENAVDIANRNQNDVHFDFSNFNIRFSK